jgi:hypothetical protein
MKHTGLLSLPGAHLDGDAVGTGEWIGQDLELLPINPNLLGDAISELLDLGANLGHRESATAGSHNRSRFQREKNIRWSQFHTPRRRSAVTRITYHSTHVTHHDSVVYEIIDDVLNVRNREL